MPRVTLRLRWRDCDLQLILQNKWGRLNWSYIYNLDDTHFRAIGIINQSVYVIWIVQMIAALKMKDASALTEERGLTKLELTHRGMFQHI